MRKIPFLFIAVLLSLTPAYSGMPNSRSFSFDYEVILKDIPHGAPEVRIWLPEAQPSPYQEVESVTINPAGIYREVYDKSFHNKIIYFIFKAPKNNLKIDVKYKIRRYEYSSKANGNSKTNSNGGEDLNKYLVSNRLMIISPEIKELAAAITKGKKTTMEKARAIYDYVLENLSYDKTIPGWGEGDTRRACLLKVGNCTDFHSLFLSLARASGIPAKFVMGVPIPRQENGEIQSYHCWAEFYDGKSGWVPVDVSEAWKDKAKKEYYFGTINEDRMEFSQGRDIVLEPPSNSEPLNYFIYPYAEANGEKFENVKVSFRFEDNSKKGGVR